MNASSPTLNDLIRLSFSEPVFWISGKNNAPCRIHWIATSLEEVQGGDLFILPPDHLAAGILAQAVEKGATAVLILGSAALSDDIYPDGLAVIAVPSQTDLRATQRLMLTILINQRAALMERGVRIHAQLSQLSAEGEGLSGLAHAMADISGRGILVQDKRGGILAAHPSSALLTIWEDVLGQLSSLESLPESLRDRKLAGSQASVVTQGIPGGLERLIIPITVGEVARGYLSLVGLNGELDALDHLVAEQGMLVCAVEMARNKAIREAEKRLKGDLLTALLQENISPRDARLWAQAMGLDLTQAHVALRFAWDGSSPPSRRRLETLVNGEVANKGLKVIVNPMGVEVICFCQVPPIASRPEISLALGQTVVDQGLREYPDTPARCGIGTPAMSLSDWRTSFRQAGQALEMARRFKEDRPLYFPDLSVYRLLFQIEHNPELIAFQEEILGPLLSYEGGRELIHTLEAYFEHNGNLSQTAEDLFIHRNTLIYRMERIAGITDLDLDKPETRLAVQLALHIYRMRGAQRS
jgi:purine catabolism regulator